MRQPSDTDLATLGSLANAILPPDPQQSPKSKEYAAQKRRLNHRRRRVRAVRERAFGIGLRIPLDRNMKAKIAAYIRWLTHTRDPNTGHWSISRAAKAVADALLWRFHNSQTGRCDPAYETIAKEAAVARSTVHQAIAALEAKKVLTWVNRRAWRKIPAPDDLLGSGATERVTHRTSNAYAFEHPQMPAIPSQSDNRTGTATKSATKTETCGKPESNPGLEAAFARLERNARPTWRTQEAQKT